MLNDERDCGGGGCGWSGCCHSYHRRKESNEHFLPAPRGNASRLEARVKWFCLRREIVGA